MSYSGKFTPKNPQKYKGDPKNIIYRSSWEVKVMKYLDDHPDVIWWGSEELVIPYWSPVDNKKHRYFPDFVAKIKQKNGMIKRFGYKGSNFYSEVVNEKAFLELRKTIIKHTANPNFILQFIDPAKQ